MEKILVEFWWTGAGLIKKEIDRSCIEKIFKYQRLAPLPVGVTKLRLGRGSMCYGYQTGTEEFKSNFGYVSDEVVNYLLEVENGKY